MKIVAAGPATFTGKKSFRVDGIKIISGDGKPLVVYVVSHSFFVDDTNLVSIAIAGDIEEVEANSDVRQLMKAMFIKPKK